MSVRLRGGGAIRRGRDDVGVRHELDTSDETAETRTGHCTARAPRTATMCVCAAHAVDSVITPDETYVWRHCDPIPFLTLTLPLRTCLKLIC